MGLFDGTDRSLPKPSAPWYLRPQLYSPPIEAESWTMGVFLGSSQLTYKDG